MASSRELGRLSRREQGSDTGTHAPDGDDPQSQRGARQVNQEFYYAAPQPQLGEIQNSLFDITWMFRSLQPGEALETATIPDRGRESDRSAPSLSQDATGSLNRSLYEAPPSGRRKRGNPPTPQGHVDQSRQPDSQQTEFVQGSSSRRKRPFVSEADQPDSPMAKLSRKEQEDSSAYRNCYTNKRFDLRTEDMKNAFKKYNKHWRLMDPERYEEKLSAERRKYAESEKFRKERVQSRKDHKQEASLWRDYANATVSELGLKSRDYETTQKVLDEFNRVTGENVTHHEFSERVIKWEKEREWKKEKKEKKEKKGGAVAFRVKLSG